MATVTLSMIVKNEENYLLECLESCKDVVDEIVIVDTGSTDNTIKIAEEYGARVFHFNWINDFSAARNLALHNSTGDWILYLDADERLTERSHSLLKKIKNEIAKIGYYCTVKSIDSDEGRDNSMSYVRLFANSNKIYFTGSVHEQIVPALQAEGYIFKESAIEIEHVGYNISPEKKKEKAERNIKLLLDEYEKNRSTYYAFQLALTYEVLENYNEAKKYFLLSAEDERFSKIYRAHSYAALSLSNFKEHSVNEAEKYVLKSLSLRYNDGFTNLLASKIYQRFGNYQKAFDYSLSAEEFNDDLIKGKQKQEYSVFLNREEVLYNILVLSEKLGKNKYIENYYRKFLEYVKNTETVSGNLMAIGITKLLNNGSLNNEELNSILNYINKKNLDLFLFIINRYKQNNLKKGILEELSRKFNDSHEIKKKLADLYVELKMQRDAYNLYYELYEKKIDDPSVYFNLLSFYVTENKVVEITGLIEEIEARFSSIPEVNRITQHIKSKLLQTA